MRLSQRASSLLYSSSSWRANVLHLKGSVGIKCNRKMHYVICISLKKKTTHTQKQTTDASAKRKFLCLREAMLCYYSRAGCGSAQYLWPPPRPPPQFCCDFLASKYKTITIIPFLTTRCCWILPTGPLKAGQTDSSFFSAVIQTQQICARNHHRMRLCCVSSGRNIPRPGRRNADVQHARSRLTNFN